jgi:hypothetical protein
VKPDGVNEIGRAGAVGEYGVPLDDLDLRLAFLQEVGRIQMLAYLFDFCIIDSH